MSSWLVKRLLGAETGHGSSPGTSPRQALLPVRAGSGGTDGWKGPLGLRLFSFSRTFSDKCHLFAQVKCVWNARSVLAKPVHWIGSPCSCLVAVLDCELRESRATSGLSRGSRVQVPHWHLAGPQLCIPQLQERLRPPRPQGPPPGPSSWSCLAHTTLHVHVWISLLAALTSRHLHVVVSVLPTRPVQS